MTERTQHDDAPGSPDPEKVHTFDLIDEVPGVSDGAPAPRSDDPDGTGPDGTGPDGTAPDGTAPDGTAPAGAPGAARREPGRGAEALAAARASVVRTARRGTAAVRRRVPESRRGRALLAGGIAVVVVLAVAAGAFVDARLRFRDLVTAPGGVRSLAEKPAELWSVDVEDPIASTLIEMPGVLAVVGGGKVQGLDPASGDVRWSVDVEPGASCGPTSWLGTGGPATTPPSDPLVCTTVPENPADDARTATVVDRDGAVTTRELDPAARVLPGPDGTLVRLDLVGDVPEPRSLVVDKTGAAHLPKGFAAPDVTVRVEDAATGEERWSETLPAGRPDANDCVTYHQDGDAAPVPRLDVAGGLGASLQHGVLEIEGCGVAAAFLPDGTRVDGPGDDADDPVGVGSSSRFTALPDGGWVGPDTTDEDGWESALPHEVAHLPHGETVRLGGRALVPWATDGRDPHLLLVRAGLNTVALSTDEDDAGQALWTARLLRSSDLLVTASGTAVVVDELGALRAVDLGTGAERWSLDPQEIGLQGMFGGVSSSVFGAYTDGDVLLLPVAADPQGAGSGLRLVAIDLGDGSVRWEIDQETPYTQIESVDGYLAQITQHGVVGLG